MGVGGLKKETAVGGLLVGQDSKSSGQGFVSWIPQGDGLFFQFFSQHLCRLVTACLYSRVKHAQRSLVKADGRWHGITDYSSRIIKVMMTVPLSILPRSKLKGRRKMARSSLSLLHSNFYTPSCVQNYNRKRFQNFWFKMNPGLETNTKFQMRNIKAHSFVHNFSSRNMRDGKQKQTRDTPPPRIYNDTTKKTVTTTVTLTVVCLPLFRNKRSVVNFTEI